MRFGCSSEFYRCRCIEPIGLARSRHGVTVSSPAFAVFRPTPAPGHLRFRVHPLLILPPLQSTTRCSPAHPLSLPCAFPGVLSSFATSASRVHVRRESHFPTMFRPQRFSRSRRFAPLAALWAYFIPLPCPRFTPQGFSPTVSRPGSSPGRSFLASAPLTCTEQAQCSSARRSPSRL
jgi:hypothetical protein